MTKQSNPELRGTRVLLRYSELSSYLQQFTEGIYRFLWVTGRPGVGKSETIQATMQGRKVLYVKSGRLTPLALYRACFEHLHQPVILDLDEMEAMMKDPDGRRLLLALGETTLSKQLHWLSTSPRLGDVPNSFETTSTLCVIANEPPLHQAIRSRATTLEFAPTNHEVHTYAADWFWDQEIHDWVGRHLSRLHPLDLRCYIEAYSDRRAGRDWADLLLRAWALDGAEVVVQDLEHDPAYPTRKDRERRFTEIMAGRKGGSRANYHIILARLRKSKRLEPEMNGSIQVRGKRPPVVAGQEETPPQPADLPQRDAFTRPVTGQTGQLGAPRQSQRTEADDTVGWERPPSNEEDE